MICQPDITELIENNLQPIHYLNEYSKYAIGLSKLINQTLVAEDVPDIYSDDVIERLCFIKPLRGIMKRKFKCDDNSEVEIEFQKNFHDEQEWRYVPPSDVAAIVKKDTVIGNTNLLKMHEKGIDINAELNENKCSSLWLKYSYEDIRYIIVPNVNARVDIINTIMSIPKNQFSNQSDVEIQKYILISNSNFAHRFCLCTLKIQYLAVIQLS